MTTFVAVLNGGKTGPEGDFRFLSKISQNGQGVIDVNDLLVVQNHLGANQSVDISIGDVVIPINTYVVPCWNDAVYNLAITANTSGSTRKDTVVAYVDLTAYSSSENNPGALKFKDVTGSPGGDFPSDADIDSSVGTTYWTRLGNLTLINNYTNISNGDIADVRTRIVFGNSSFIRSFTFAGDLTVNDDIDFHSIVPIGMTAINRLDACLKTAPSGDAVVLRLWNITQAQEVGSVTIADGSSTGFNNAPTNASVNPGDILRLDCTNIGVGVAGADAELQMSP